jgi:hypothetical protein
MGSLTKEDRAMSNTIDKATCADLIAGELKDREQQLEQLYTPPMMAMMMQESRSMRWPTV